jgi:hypothetical protein
VNLRLIFRKPYEFGYGIKRIVEDGDFQFTLSHAGWVGNLQAFLPRPTFDDLRLGDEIEVVDESGNVVWLGKIVRQRFTHDGKQQIDAKGLTEFLLDLPVDCVLYQSSNWSVGQFWKAACQVARVHWSRLVTPSISVTDSLGTNSVDLRGQNLGSAYRFLLDMGFDVALKMQKESGTNRIIPQLQYRSDELVTLPIDFFADWSIEYDASQVQNRLLLSPTNAEIFKNLLSDGSFEDYNSERWEIVGSGSGWSVERKGVYDLGAERIIGIMEGTVLRVFIPQQSPAGYVDIRTRSEVELAPGTYRMGIWAYSAAAVGTINAFIGSTFNTAVSISAGLNYYEWTWNITSHTRAKVGFRITGSTSSPLTVYLDAASLSRYLGRNSLLRPVGSNDDFLSEVDTFLAQSNLFKITRVEPSGTNFNLYLDRGIWHSLDGTLGSGVPAGTKGELWDYYYQQEWRFTVVANNPPYRLTVSIDKYPPGNPAPYVGLLGRILFWQGDENKAASEAYYGVRYGSLSLPSNLGFAAMRSLVAPNIVFEGTVVGQDVLIDPTGKLRLLRFGIAEISILPIVENVVTVRAGEVVAQKIKAGDRELTFRGLVRQILEQQRNYTVAKTK